MAQYKQKEVVKNMLGLDRSQLITESEKKIMDEINNLKLSSSNPQAATPLKQQAASKAVLLKLSARKAKHAQKPQEEVSNMPGEESKTLDDNKYNTIDYGNANSSSVVSSSEKQEYFSKLHDENKLLLTLLEVRLHLIITIIIFPFSKYFYPFPNRI